MGAVLGLGLDVHCQVLALAVPPSPARSPSACCSGPEEPLPGPRWLLPLLASARGARQALAAALGAEVKRPSARPRERAALAAALGRAAEEGDRGALAALAACAEDADSLVRKAAVEAIGFVASRGDAAAEATLKCRLGDGSEGVVQAAIQAFEQLALPGDAATLTALRSCLWAEGWETRRRALEAISNLGEMGDAGALGMLALGLEDANRWVRVAAVEAIANLTWRGEWHAMEAIAPRLSDEVWCVRVAALAAFAKVAERGDDLAVAAVASRLEDEYASVRIAALEAISEMVPLGAREPGPWKDAVGVFYGMRFPWSERTVKWLGPPWLTKAFRAAGTLTEEGEVTNIISLRSLGCRGAAERLLLTVEYGPGQMGMHTKLLVKVPLEDSERFGVKRSERADYQAPVGSLPPLRPVDYFAEINFCRLYEDEAPFRMPKYYYGDISDRTSKYILIQEWVPLPGETDDARQGEVPPLYAAEPTATLDEEYAKNDEHTFLVGPHGSLLGVDNRSQLLVMMSRKDETTTWLLRPADEERTKHFLISPDGMYLAVGSKREQAIFFTTSPSTDAQWTLIHVTGERHKVFLKSSHGTYLASLDDANESLYMSPRADDWEKWRRVPAKTDDEAADATIEHLELRGADFHVCRELVQAGAAFAGAHKDGKLGSASTIEANFERMSCPSERLWARDAEWRGLGDTEFIEKAAVAQEFILKMGAALFPEGVVTAATMKGYRAMLVTTRANLDHIRWYCMSREDYVALGHDRIDMDSAFRWHNNSGDRSGTGLRDWESVSVGPLGFKIWAWLRFAESDVLQSQADSLLRIFIQVYASSGGPHLELEDLRNQMYLAAALDSVQLLSAVPEIYRCWPKDKWTSIKGLRDKRVLGQTLGQQSLWLCLKSLVNIALVLSTCDMVELLSQVMPLIFHDAVHKATSSEEFFTGPDGAEVRASPEPGAPLICRLPENCPLTGTGRWAEVESKKGRAGEGKQLAEVKLPVYGWVDFEDIQPAEDEMSVVDPTLVATCDILERMYHTRRQYTGCTPLGMSAISTMKLMDTLRLYDKMFHVLQRFGHGDCQMVTGGFLVEETRRKWWPKGYEDWAHHTFLVFDDGTIADITADQYDDLPQLWYPADERRYTFDSSKPDQAEYAREQLGVKRWTDAVERDKGIPPARKRYRWWAENQSPLLPDSMRSGARKGVGANGKLKEAPKKSLKAPGADPAVLRDGEPIKLPPVSRHVVMGDGRPSATFRRISEENELEVWLVENIFQPAELEDLIRLCDLRNGFEPSLQNASSGQRVQDGRRTSLSCSLHWPLLFGGGSLEEVQQKGVSPEVQEELAAAQHITGLCSRALEVDALCIEPLQLVKYTPGQYYGRHMDTHKEPERLSSHNGEQRTHTLLVFLTDVPADDGGGHLHFPLLRLRFLPRAGSAVLWRNTRGPDHRPDPNSLHEGEPPLKSNKIAMNVWVVDRPFTAESVMEGRQRKIMLAEKAAQQVAPIAKPTQALGEKEPLLLRKLREQAEIDEDSDEEPPLRPPQRETPAPAELPACPPTVASKLAEQPGASQPAAPEPAPAPAQPERAAGESAEEEWDCWGKEEAEGAEEAPDAKCQEAGDAELKAEEPSSPELEPFYDLAGDCPFPPLVLPSPPSLVTLLGSVGPAECGVADASFDAPAWLST